MSIRSRSMRGNYFDIAAGKLDLFSDGSGVAYYKFDGNGNNEAGNLHLTENSVTYGSGKYGRAVNFNGTSGYLASQLGSAPSGGIMSPLYLQDFTISFSVMLTTAKAQPIFNICNDSWYYGYGIYINADNTIRFEAHTAVGGVLTTAASTATVTLNTWNSVIVSYSNRNVTIYVNGIASQTVTVAADILYTSVMRLYVGRAYTLYASASVDNMRFLNRSVSALEASILYNEEAPAKLIDTVQVFGTNNVKAMYKFENSLVDATGGQNLGSVGTVAYQSGVNGNCVKFNGTNTLLDTPLRIDNSEMTVSMWINPTAVSGTYALFGNRDNLNTDGSGVLCSIEVGKLAVYPRLNSLLINSPVNTFPFTGVWYHVAVTFSASGVVAYVNGNAVATSAVPTGLSQVNQVSTNMFRLGGTFNATPQYYSGLMDNVRFFNKALSASEVSSLYKENTYSGQPLASIVDPFSDGKGKYLWRFQGNGLDEGGALSASAASGITYVSGGNFDQAASMTAGSYTFPSVPAGVIGSSFSYSFMVKLNSGYTTNSHTIFDFKKNRDRLFIMGTGGEVAAGTIALYNEVTASYAYSTTVLQAARWYHLVVTFSGGVMTVYVDGALSSQYGGLNIAEPSGVFRIGADYLGSGSFLQGSIKQARIFSRALTAAEAEILYTNQA